MSAADASCVVRQASYWCRQTAGYFCAAALALTTYVSAVAIAARAESRIWAFIIECYGKLVQIGRRIVLPFVLGMKCYAWTVSKYLTFLFSAPCEMEVK